MKTIKGPAVFLAQFVDDKPPFNSLDGLCQWTADIEYKGIQIPTWENALIDMNSFKLFILPATPKVIGAFCPLILSFSS